MQNARMAKSKDITENMDPTVWRDQLLSYDSCLVYMAKKKTKSESSRDLIRLDKWVQTELPDVIDARSPAHINLAELVDIMRWKLLRGKFRPRLVELAGSNQEKDVIAISTKAFKLATKGQLKSAIEETSKLKGVGPATASAILSIGCPVEVAFMADESVWGLLGKQSLKYNIQEYLGYMEKVKKCKDSLNKADAQFGWTAHQVELCVWVAYHSSNNGFVSTSGDAHSDTDEISVKKGSKRKKETTSVSQKKAKK